MLAQLLLLLTVAPLAVPEQSPDTLVVCPAALRQALEPWVGYRTKEGHAISIIPNSPSAEELKQKVREAAKGGRLKFVVLVGNAPPPPSDRVAAAKPNSIAMFNEKAKVNILWGSEPTIATDNGYADINDDQSPELAVGRLTADTPEQLQKIVAKILNYEQSDDFGQWRRRMNLVAGVGGFGALADGLIESAARLLVTQNIPAAYLVSMTYGSWTSPYCPDPREFHATTLSRLDEESLFWIYIGHSSPGAVDRLHMPDRDYPILSANDLSQLSNRRARPIAVFLSCYAGAIDLNPNCLAAEMLRQPGGPVAVLAGSRVTMPYSMSVMATGLIDEVFQKHSPTLGEAVLHSKQRMMKESGGGGAQRAILDLVAKAISPAPKQLAEERAEHVWMFNLIGDPLLRLRHAQPIDLKTAENAAAGGTLKVNGAAPIDGRGVVELSLRRGRMTFTPPSRREYPRTPEPLAEFQEVYKKANDQRLLSIPIVAKDGRFEVNIAVPADAEGSCHVCAFIEGANDFALGSADVRIEKKE
jgi:hypothetical protein